MRAHERSCIDLYSCTYNRQTHEFTFTSSYEATKDLRVAPAIVLSSGTDFYQSNTGSGRTTVLDSNDALASAKVVVPSTIAADTPNARELFQMALTPENHPWKLFRIICNPTKTHLRFANVKHLAQLRLFVANLTINHPTHQLWAQFVQEHPQYHLETASFSNYRQSDSGTEIQTDVRAYDQPDAKPMNFIYQHQDRDRIK